MKKKLAILISLMMVMSFTFAACGGGGSSESSEGTDYSDSKYVGTWKVESLAIGSESEDVDDGGEWTLTLNSDGTGKSVSVDGESGETEETNFTWEPTSDGFKTSGDTKLTFKDDGDGIVTKFLGADIRFVKLGEGGESENNSAETEEETNTSDVAKYGYTGTDPIEAAVYQYLCETIAPQYDMPEGAITIPVVQVIDVDVDDDDGDAEVLGDFWVLNYVVEGDTLKCVSGGAHPGKMDLNKVGDAYVVEEFEGVQDGSNYDSSAKDIFEEHYDEFSKVSSDEKTREKVRAENIANYVKATGLNVTKYQDEGWDPVELAL
jgi:hypothetical protein